MKRTILTSTLAVLALLSVPAQAAVISGAATGGSAVTTYGGTFINLGFSPPAAVGDDDQDDPNLYAFNEDQNIVLTSGTGTIDVDCLVSPSLTCSSGTLGLGTTVASQYVFFDPLVSSRMIGNVTFDAPILAVIHSTSLLAASDFLINNAVTYNSPGLRGLEHPSPDTFSIGTTNLFGDTLFLDWTASTPGDYVRVLTAFSPVADALPGPGAIALLGLGLFGLGAVRRRTR